MDEFGRAAALAPRSRVLSGATAGRRLRLLFFGTPDFAVPTLERLLAGPHEVVAAVSQPDRPRGRGQRVTASPVAECAERAGIPALRTERVGDPDFVARLAELGADVGIVAAFGQFLPRRVRELPRLGYLINAHASLLPRHRGAAPIAHALLAGDREAGVCAMRVEREMDAGPTAVVARTPIGPDENAGELSDRLALLAADVIADALERVVAGTIEWTPQRAEDATLAPKLTRDDAHLDLREPADALVPRVRAMAPRPGAFLSLREERLRILAADAASGEAGRPPGRVALGADRRPRIATGRGWLLPRVLQRAGGRAQEVDAFQRGRGLAEGDRLVGREGEMA